MFFRKWGVSDSDEKYAYYMDFVKIVSNTSYRTLDLYEKFMDDDTLKNVDFLELASSVRDEFWRKFSFY